MLVPRTPKRLPVPAGFGACNRERRYGAPRSPAPAAARPGPIGHGRKRKAKPDLRVPILPLANRASTGTDHRRAGTLVAPRSKIPKSARPLAPMGGSIIPGWVAGEGSGTGDGAGGGRAGGAGKSISRAGARAEQSRARVERAGRKPGKDGEKPWRKGRKKRLLRAFGNP